MQKTLTMLHGMLETTKYNIKKNSIHMMMVKKYSKKQKCFTKGKGKGVAKDEISNPNAKTKSSPSPNEKCFNCGDLGHQSRKCKKYFKDKKKKGSETSALDVYVIEINLVVSSGEWWLFDIGLMYHTCNFLHGLNIIFITLIQKGFGLMI